MLITVIIPTYNEAENLPKLVSALFTLPKDTPCGLPLDIHLLVVDDNSPDGTGEIGDRLKARHPGKIKVLHRAGKQGLRCAYLSGFRTALEEGAEAVAQMDADFSHDPKILVEMAELIESCDVVLGSRYIQGGSVDEQWPAWRKGLSAFGNYYARTILDFPIRDVTTGYRLWRRETLEAMPLERIQSNGYVFLAEMAYQAYCLEYHCGEVPIYFADRRWGKSKMSLRIMLEAALRVWKVRWDYRDLRKAGRSARVC